MNSENKRALTDFGLGLALFALVCCIAWLTPIQYLSPQMLASLAAVPVGAGVIAFLRRGSIFPCAVGVTTGGLLPALFLGGPTSGALDMGLAVLLGGAAMIGGAFGVIVRVLLRSRMRDTNDV